MLALTGDQIQALHAAEAAVATRFGSHRPARINEIEFLDQTGRPGRIVVKVGVVPSNPSYFSFPPETIVFEVDLEAMMVYEGDRLYWLHSESYYALTVLTASQRAPITAPAEVLAGL